MSSKTKDNMCSTSTTTTLTPGSKKYLDTKIFRSQVPITIVYQLLEGICVKETTCCKFPAYCFDDNAFRKLQFQQDIYHTFLNTLLPYYHFGKQHYLTKHHTSMNSFMTILKQICKHHGIPIEHRIKYREGIKFHEFLIAVGKPTTSSL